MLPWRGREAARRDHQPQLVYELMTRDTRSVMKKPWFLRGIRVCGGWGKPQPPHVRFSSPGKGPFHHPARQSHRTGPRGGRADRSTSPCPKRALREGAKQQRVSGKREENASALRASAVQGGSVLRFVLGFPLRYNHAPASRPDIPPLGGLLDESSRLPGIAGCGRHGRGTGSVDQVHRPHASRSR